MTRILYIGDPSSVHDLKWMSYFSLQPHFEVFLVAQEHEVNALTQAGRQQLQQLHITLEAPIKSYSLWRLWDNAYSLKIIHRIINHRKIDVVHALFATPFALWTHRVALPAIITCRGSDVHVVLASLGKGSFLQRMHGLLLRKQFHAAFKHAAAITCTSQGQLHKLNQLFDATLQAQIIRTGVNVASIAQQTQTMALPAAVSHRKIIFLPRYIRPIYQTHVQVAALSLLRPELKNQLALVLIKGKNTDTSYQNQLLEALRACGIPFHIYDSLTQAQMAAVFKQSALTIMTPKTDGTPNSALEAMAARCPLIMGSFGYDQDLFSDKFCLRTSSDTPQELAKLIEDAICNYPQQKVEAAFENVTKRGNRPVEMKRLENLYLTLLKR